MQKNTSNVVPFQIDVSNRVELENDVNGLFELYGDRLRGFLRKSLPTDGEIEDIVQEVFCRIIEYERFGKIDNHAAFLYKLARNILIDRYRKQSSQSDVKRKLSNELNSSLQEGAYFVYNEMAIAFGEAVKELPTRCRQVFLMRRRDGLSNSEIAEILGISLRMVQKHMTRALIHFQERLR